MTVAEFIAATQWPLLILLVLLTFTLAMVFSKTFRKGVLNRRWRLGMDGIFSEPAPPSPDDMQDAIRTDEEVQAALGGEGGEEPPDAEDITTFRREAVEALMRDAAHWGWYQAQMGFRNPPDPHVDWEAAKGPKIRYGTASAPDRDSALERQLRNKLAHDEAAPTSIGALIRLARNNANLTQQQLAQETGLSVMTIQRIEAGRGSIRVHHLRVIAGVLGVPLQELLM